MYLYVTELCVCVCNFIMCIYGCVYIVCVHAYICMLRDICEYIYMRVCVCATGL